MLEQEFKLTAPNKDTLNIVFESEIFWPYLSDTSIPPQRFLAVYYDTPDRQLESARVSLRARLEGAKIRAAFKLPGKIIDGLSSRLEYETDLEGWIEDLDSIPDSELKDELFNYIDPKSVLVSLVKTDIHRRTMMIDKDGSSIEVVADHGSISANGKEQQLSELEMELKSGDVNAIQEIADQLMSRYELVPSVVTKHEIGLNLLNQN